MEQIFEQNQIREKKYEMFEVNLKCDLVQSYSRDPEKLLMMNIYASLQVAEFVNKEVEVLYFRDFSFEIVLKNLMLNLIILTTKRFSAPWKLFTN